MIKLSPQSALMLYLGVTLIVILGVWILHHFSRKSRFNLTPNEALMECEYCHFAYLKRSEQIVSQCPRCKSFND